MNYTIESVGSVQTDIETLIQNHALEVGDNLALDPDIEAYTALEDAGVLRVFGVREEGLLVGYATFIVSSSNLHHKGLRCAANDMLYVMPKHRGITGTRLMAYAESVLASEGKIAVTLHVPSICDWRSLAKRWGYAQIETVMMKRLGD